MTFGALGRQRLVGSIKNEIIIYIHIYKETLFLRALLQKSYLQRHNARSLLQKSHIQIGLFLH